MADGLSYAAVCQVLGVTDRFIARWKRFGAGGVLALADAPRAGPQDDRVTPAQEARILHRTQHARPPAPLTHWTSTRLAERVGVSPSSVQRVWQRAGLRQQRAVVRKGSVEPSQCYPPVVVIACVGVGGSHAEPRQDGMLGRQAEPQPGRRDFKVLVDFHRGAERPGAESTSLQTCVLRSECRRSQRNRIVCTTARCSIWLAESGE